MNWLGPLGRPTSYYLEGQQHRMSVKQAWEDRFGLDLMLLSFFFLTNHLKLHLYDLQFCKHKEAKFRGSFFFLFGV